MDRLLNSLVRMDLFLNRKFSLDILTEKKMKNEKMKKRKSEKVKKKVLISISKTVNKPVHIEMQIGRKKNHSIRHKK